MRSVLVLIKRTQIRCLIIKMEIFVTIVLLWRCKSMWTHYSSLKRHSTNLSHTVTNKKRSIFGAIGLHEEKNELSKSIFLDTTGIRNIPPPLHSKCHQRCQWGIERCGIYMTPQNENKFYFFSCPQATICLCGCLRSYVCSVNKVCLLC